MMHHFNSDFLATASFDKVFYEALAEVMLVMFYMPDLGKMVLFSIDFLGIGLYFSVNLILKCVY